MRSVRTMIFAAAAACLLASCANQQEPAEKALAQAETALAEFRADAETYAAEQLEDVEDSVNNLKNNMARKDYGAVVRLSPSVMASIGELKTKVAAAKSEAESTLAAAQEEWTELSSSMPQMVDALQKRVDTISRTKRLPKDMDQATFDAAKAAFEEMKSSWTQASADFSEGKAAEALRKARAAKARSEQLTEMLGA